MYMLKMVCVKCEGDFESRKVYVTGCIGGSTRWRLACPKCQPKLPKCEGCPPTDQCSQCQQKPHE